MRSMSKQAGLREELRRGWYLGVAAVRSVLDLGPGTTRLAITNTFSQGINSAIRQLADKQQGIPGGVGELLGYEEISNGALFRFRDAILEVRVMTDHVVRITWEPGILPVPYSLRDGWPPPAAEDPQVSFEYSIDGCYILRYNNYAIRVYPTGEVQFSACRSTSSDQSHGGFGVSNSSGAGKSGMFDGSGESGESSGFDSSSGSHSSREEIGRHKKAEVLLCRDLSPARAGERWTIDRQHRAGSLVCGLGEKAAHVDLSGQVARSNTVSGKARSYRLWNRDPGGLWGPGVDPLYMSIPFTVSIDPKHPDIVMGCFYENSWQSTFSFPADSDSLMKSTFAGGALRYYLMAGTLGEVLSHYTGITGRPPLPPRWALGYHQSRWGYKTERDIHDVVDNFKSMDIPLSAIHLDIDYMDGYKVFTIDHLRFPDMKTLADQLAEQGIRIVTILDPAVKADSSSQYGLYEEGVEGEHFCKNPQGEVQLGVVWPGRAAFPDFTNPSTREWWADKYDFFSSHGIAGVWHDMNEPTNIALLGDKTLPLGTLHNMDGRGGEHAEAHNLYALEMNRSGYAGLRKVYPDKRPFILSRSGWAGSQRYAWGWTGDTESTWEALRQQIPTMIGLGMSGFPFSGPDIGGFNGAPSAELYLRWLQLSTFLPFCRTHSVAGAPLREPWRLPEYIRPYVANYIRLRYRLLPYLYTLAYEASTSGTPLIRPLGWVENSDSSDSLIWEIDDAFMLGGSVLVAPVTAPGKASRLVRLPKGTWSPWLDGSYSGSLENSEGNLKDPGESIQRENVQSENVQRENVQLRKYHSGQSDQINRLRGGRVVRLPAPLENIPVLVRHGSILPLDDGWLNTSGCVPDLEHRPKMLSFHIWPDERGLARGTCYDDCGDGYGEMRMDDMAFTHEGDTATISWSREGSYAAPDKVGIVLHGMAATRCYADGKRINMDEPDILHQLFTVTCPPFATLRMEGVALL